MSLLRILLVLAAGYLVYRLVRHLLRPPAPRPQPETESHTHLIRCDQCNTLIPPDAVIDASNRHYCSEKCRITSETRS